MLKNNRWRRWRRRITSCPESGYWAAAGERAGIRLDWLARSVSVCEKRTKCMGVLWGSGLFEVFRGSSTLCVRYSHIHGKRTGDLVGWVVRERVTFSRPKTNYFYRKYTLAFFWHSLSLALYGKCSLTLYLFLLERRRLFNVYVYVKQALSLTLSNVSLSLLTANSTAKLAESLHKKFQEKCT